MYPIINIFGIQIYTFGIALTISFFLFLWMLKKLAKKEDINFSFFSNRILYFFISTVFFSRVFYLIAHYKTEVSYIDNFWDFIFMEHYNFSLYGAIFGFLLVLIISLKKAGIDYKKYLDISVITLFFVLVFGYLGALLGGQVIGKPTDLGIELHYDNEFSPIGPDIGVFPLAIVYSIIYFVIFSVFYSLVLFVKTKGFLGTIGLMLLAGVVFALEPFSYFYKDDFFMSFGISFPQLLSIITVGIGFIFLFMLKADRKERKA